MPVKRARQNIGRLIESGVLRKEDEAKYSKMSDAKLLQEYGRLMEGGVIRSEDKAKIKSISDLKAAKAALQKKSED